MMKVMKLSDSGNATERHLEKRHPRSVIDVFWRKAVGGAVHHLAPGPEAIFGVTCAVFRSAPNYSLKSVRVRINQPRQHRAILEGERLVRVLVVVYSGDVSTAIIADERETACELTLSKDQVWHPGCWADIIHHEVV